MGDGHFEWRNIDRVRRKVVDEVLWLGKVIDQHVKNLIDGTSSDESAYDLFNSLLEMRLFAIGSFMIGNFK